jgi:two-component system, cell cycle sensor histidine kinase and response regulator CckA
MTALINSSADRDLLRVTAASQQHFVSLARVFEATSDMVVVLDCHQHVLFANHAFAKETGWSESEVVGSDAARILPPEWLNTGTSATRRLAAVRRNGSRFPCLVRCARLRNDAGEWIGFAISATNITAFMPDDEADQLLKCLSRAAFDGFLLHEAGVITAANERAASMFRCDASELIGRNIIELTSAPYHDVVLEHVRSRSSKPYESICRRPDGSTFPVEVRGVSREHSEIRVVALHDLTERKQAERELRRREERFRVLADAAFDGILVERDGVVLEANDALARMLGYQEEELRGVAVTSLILTDRTDTTTAEKRTRITALGVRKDGGTFPVELCVAAISDGQTIYAMRDVTREQHAEQQLIESERRYRELSESTHDLLCNHDEDGNVTEVNAAALRALGYSREEFQHVTIRDILAPEMACQYDSYIKALRLDGVAEGLMTVVTRTGERRIWHYQNALRTSGVERPLVRGLARDVTEREMALQALRKSEEHYRFIIENISDLLSIIDATGVVQFYSPSVQRALGYPAEMLAGRHFAEFIHPDDLRAVQEFFVAQVSSLDGHGTIDARIGLADGSWRWYSIASTTRVIREKVSLIVNARDVTERRLLLSQLEQANRVSSLGRLAATVAHEFNNVLMGMQPFAELMQRPGVSPDVMVKGAGHILTSIGRGKRVALDILRFTQPAAPAIKPVTLLEWWERIAPELYVTLGNSIAIEASVPPDIAVMADSRQLAQVLLNLASNARDAMPAGGQLTVEARRPRPQDTFRFGVVRNPHTFVHITVADNGIGMPADVVPHAFDPLFTTKQNGGTGLGLAVVHQVVTGHGGAIFMESECGKGTSFHLFIPAAEPAPQAVASEEVPELAPIRALVVDDEPGIIEGLTAALEMFGVDTIGAGTAAEAEVTAACWHPDLAIVDVRLPDGDGIELGALLREEHPSLKIIYASGHADARRVRNADSGMVAFLQKPFGIKTLIETMVRLGFGSRQNES